jgi:serine protease Do
MRMTRVLKLMAFGILPLFLLVASGVVNIQVDVRDNIASALDLFGDDEESEAAPEAPGTPFWSENGGESIPVAPPAGAPSSFADLASRVSPAIVNIQTRRTVGGTGSTPRQRHPLEEFFGPGFGEFFERPRVVPSLGTGFVISAEGYIVTNNHVIEDVDKVEVHFLDGRELEAEVVGRDPKTDVALIRVESETSLPFLPLGDSDAIRPGDWVVAIGNPFGLEHTVTAGIVSAKHREINSDPGSRRFDDFLQTDAAINPGNSGGPLMNLSGEVVGINTAINPRANTIGFAIPVNLAKQVLPQLRSTGRVSRGWLGVYIQAIDDDTADLLGLSGKSGALVSKVEPGGPADEAGIQRGDVIIEFNGQPVDEMDALPRLVAAAPVGSSAKVKVLRKGEEKELEVGLGELEQGEQLAAGGSEPETGAYGLTVQQLTPEIASQLGLEEASGVLISAVEPESPAALAQLLTQSEKGALLLVRRGRAEIFVPLKP